MMTCALKTSGISRARLMKNRAGSSRAVRVAVRASKTNEVCIGVDLGLFDAMTRCDDIKHRLQRHAERCHFRFSHFSRQPSFLQVNDVAKAAAVMSLASPLLFSESASAAQEMMTVADGRGGLLLFPIAAALGWVLFNIAGPTKNQIDNMSK